MIVWTINSGESGEVLELQWIEPTGRTYLFGVKLTRQLHSELVEEGRLEEILDEDISYEALLGLRDYTGPALAADRPEIVRLAVRAPIGSLVWDDARGEAVWREHEPSKGEGE